MEHTIENRRLMELLYMRERTLQRLRRSHDLHETWKLYQDLKLITQYIDHFEKPAISA